jgi:hypothetical protein
MLRYVKTLLMFIWTTVISFLMLPLLKDTHFSPFIVLGAGYVVWSLAVIWIIDFPLYWIYRHRQSHIPSDHIDPQLQLMQDTIAPYAKIAIASSIIGLVLALLSHTI